MVYEADGNLRFAGDTTPIQDSPSCKLLISEILTSQPRSERARRQIFYQVASAVDRCIAGDRDNAESTLTQVRDRSRKVRLIEQQLSYLSGCAGITCLIWVVFIWFAVRFFGAFEAASSAVQILRILGLGAVGGLLSVVINLRKIEVENEAGLSVHFIVGATRASIASLAGVVMYLGIKGNLFLGIADQSSSLYAIYLLCILAGFSETLVPNSLTKLEGT